MERKERSEFPYGPVLIIGGAGVVLYLVLNSKAAGVVSDAIGAIGTVLSVPLEYAEDAVESITVVEDTAQGVADKIVSAIEAAHAKEEAELDALGYTEEEKAEYYKKKLAAQQAEGSNSQTKKVVGSITSPWEKLLPWNW